MKYQKAYEQESKRNGAFSEVNIFENDIFENNSAMEMHANKWSKFVCK